jgi:hypothetical protein
MKQLPAELLRLIATGRATVAEVDLREFLDRHPPLSPTRGERPLSELVIEMRTQERE